MIGLVAGCLLAALGGPASARTESNRGECLIFVLRDCPIANQYTPELQRLIKTYSAKGIQFEMVFDDPDITAKAISEHQREYGFEIPTMMDADHRLAKKYGVAISPTVVLKKATTVYYVGRIDDTYATVSLRRSVPKSHDLRDAFDALLAGRTVKMKRTTAVGCRLY